MNIHFGLCAHSTSSKLIQLSLSLSIVGAALNGNPTAPGKQWLNY
jgi:hypothetical protein